MLCAWKAVTALVQVPCHEHRYMFYGVSCLQNLTQSGPAIHVFLSLFPVL